MPTTNVSTNSQATQTSERKTLLQYFTNTGLGNVLGALGIAIAIASLGQTAYASAVQVVTTKWSARNDAFESCVAAYSIDVFSAYCNKTIGDGVSEPPSMVRRTLFSLSPNSTRPPPGVLYGIGADTPEMYSARVVLTFAVAIFTFILCHPYYETALLRSAIGEPATFIYAAQDGPGESQILRYWHPTYWLAADSNEHAEVSIEDGLKFLRAVLTGSSLGKAQRACNNRAKFSSREQSAAGQV